MSNEIFPILPGLEWNSTKAPFFKTNVMESVSGREIRHSYQIAPKFNITLSYEFLREKKGRNELQQIEGFFIARRGSYESFLLAVPDDNEFEVELVGDGVRTQFAAIKPGLGIPLIYTKPQNAATAAIKMWRPNSALNMWSNNESKKMWSQSKISLNQSGVITLTEPLDDGATLSVSGNFYYKCRFADDSQDYTNFAYKFWKTSKIEFIGTLGNKI